MRPPVWQLVREAMDHFNRDVSYSEIKKRVLSEYPDVNPSTLTCQLVICSVNHPSRIHYPENRKPRISTGQYDFLYHTARGRVEPYDSEKHGIWEIAEVEGSDRLVVRLFGEPVEESVASSSEPGDDYQATFALESHLRDYLGRNLSLLGNFSEPLNVYTSLDGREGIEFQTDVGPM